MISLADLVLIVFAFTVLVQAIVLVVGIWRFQSRANRSDADGPGRLLDAAVRRMPAERSEWGRAMTAELGQIQGTSSRWRFALGCGAAALFPPATTAWPRYMRDAFGRLGPVCGILSVALPPLGLLLLYAAGVAANELTTHDNFFNGELLPGVIGVSILASFAWILSGVPLGIAGLVRREQASWLSYLGPLLSIGVFSCLMVVQHLAAPHLR